MDEDQPGWVRQGFETAVSALASLPRMGHDPATCAHAIVLPYRPLFGVASRRTIRFGRCVACGQSTRLCGAA